MITKFQILFSFNRIYRSYTVIQIKLEMASLMLNQMPRMKLSDEIWGMIDTILKRKHKLRKMIFGRKKYSGRLHNEFNIAPSQSLELESFKRKLEKFLSMTDCKERDDQIFGIFQSQKHCECSCRKLKNLKCKG